MGTHPIFESDFDCLTEIMSARSDESAFSDSDESAHSEKSAPEKPRSTYSDSFGDENFSSRNSSAKYSESILSKATTLRNSEATTHRSYQSSAVRSIGKKKSVAPSRVTTGQTKKIDPVTARILSAHHKRR